MFGVRLPGKGKKKEEKNHLSVFMISRNKIMDLLLCPWIFFVLGYLNWKKEFILWSVHKVTNLLVQILPSGRPDPKNKKIEKYPVSKCHLKGQKCSQLIQEWIYMEKTSELLVSILDIMSLLGYSAYEIKITLFDKCVTFKFLFALDTIRSIGNIFGWKRVGNS